MKIGLIIAISVSVVLLGVIIVLLRAAIKFTDKHEKTKLQLRKAKAKIMDLQEDKRCLIHQLADANDEIEKWKLKAVEISINAQKESER